MLYQIITLRESYNLTNEDEAENFILEKITKEENNQYNGFVRRSSLDDAKKTLQACKDSFNKMVIISIDDTSQDYCIKEFHYLQNETFSEKKLDGEEIEIEFTSEKISPKKMYP
ncbi:MAG: hypothetical protein LEGION0398_MBIBDBAK_01067 [Legionellaceae bacterium]